jgi:hypothetical protein
MTARRSHQRCHGVTSAPTLGHHLPHHRGATSTSLQHLKLGGFFPSHCATSSRKGEPLDHALMTQIMFMRDPKYVKVGRTGPTWIHEIFVWDPHQVGPTHFGLWGPQFDCGIHG